MADDSDVEYTHDGNHYEYDLPETAPTDCPVCGDKYQKRTKNVTFHLPDFSGKICHGSGDGYVYIHRHP